MEGICDREAAGEGEAARCSRTLDALQLALCLLWLAGWSSIFTGQEAGCAQSCQLLHQQVRCFPLLCQ